MPTLTLRPSDGFDRLIAGLDQFRAALDANCDDPDVGAGVADAVHVYFGAVRQRYLAAGWGDGTWAELSPATVYRRLARGGARRGRGDLAQLRGVVRILYDTGTLYSSLSPGSPGWFEAADRQGVTAGTLVPYARFHQDGTARMPARPILVPPDAGTLDQMTGRVQAGIAAAFTRAFGG